MKLNDIAHAQIENSVAWWIKSQQTRHHTEPDSLDKYFDAINGHTLDLFSAARKFVLEGNDKNSAFIYPQGFDVRVNFLFIYTYDLSDVDFSWLTQCEDLDLNYCKLGNLLNHPEKFNIRGLESVSVHTHIDEVASIIGIFGTDLRLALNFQEAFPDGHSLYIRRDASGKIAIRKYKHPHGNWLLAEPQNVFELQDWLINNNFENLV